MDDRPWGPFEDVNKVSLDALCFIIFGEGYFRAHSATGSALQSIQELDNAGVERLRDSGGMDKVIKFSEAHLDEVLLATLSSIKTVSDVQ